MSGRLLNESLDYFLREDDLLKNFTYFNNLPNKKVNCHLHFKTKGVIAGLSFFREVFRFLGDTSFDPKEFDSFEGKKITKKETLTFQMPFSVALTGERVALNLLQRSCAIASTTSSFVEKAKKYNIQILDTRKTTPGLRFLEKYAVNIGGGSNHRLGQCDVFMIKDNHKKILGGLKGALEFFKNQHGFYTPIMAEIHDFEELKTAISLEIKHLMLDNFTPAQIKKAVLMKPINTTFEISGGINKGNIENFLIKGVDAISMGCLTQAPDPFDISLKMEKK